ncbi:MAG: hypothetical protein KatS3mg111_0634 [Pirellulaceae bacterium]|nr:MAG: hypothetical protein KatS3mg111_0634 [Pirellulaceae bacterium]
MRTVAITEQGTRLRAEGKFLVLESEGRAIKKLRTHDIEQLLLFGNVELSAGAIALLTRTEIDTVFLTLRGSFRARLWTRDSKNVVLRCDQWRRAGDDLFTLDAAKRIVLGKATYQRQILLRAQRGLQDPALADALTRMRVLIDQMQVAESVDAVRGYEGILAALYFGHFGKLINQGEFQFQGRNRRPPRDPVNAMLSFAYALLLGVVEAEVLRVGLDPYLGYFHAPARGRPSMVLDLMEEFRPTMDQLVLRIINRRQVGTADFERKFAESYEAILQEEPEDADPYDVERGIPAVLDEEQAADQEPWRPDRPAVYLGQTGRKVFLGEFFRRMREPVFYPPRGQRLELRDVIRQQCYHLARVIQGEEPEYQAFVPK